jgi:tRNA pseudouridine38-40 synthase
MPRYKLTIEYDGRPFQGWQRLGDGAPSVQSTLEAAALALCGDAVDVIGAGRTDSGVHATHQIAHVDLPRPLPPEVVRNALNAHLRPAPVAVLDVTEVDPEFHARFDAVARAYRYRIVNRRADLALDAGRAWRVGRPLDTEIMADAARRLLGKHDFTTFRDSQCQAPNPLKTLDVAEVVRDGDVVELRFEARSFLHRQVRSMVGTLAEAGYGRRSADDVEAALAARDRSACGQVAPADGLYLVRVDYAK